MPQVLSEDKYVAWLTANLDFPFYRNIHILLNGFVSRFHVAAGDNLRIAPIRFAHVT
ncbi:hypothetical protein D3C84_1200840 [compost metagenome]